MRITFTIGSLQVGGAEHVLVTLTKGLTGAGHHLTIITMFGAESDFFTLPPGVERVALALDKVSPTPFHAVANNVRRMWALRRAIIDSKPDVVVAHIFENGVLNLLALCGSKIPVVVLEQTDPTLQQSKGSWERLRRLTYPWAAKIVSSSAGMDEKFRWLPDAKRAVIYNPMPDIDEPGEVIFPDDGRKRLIGVARLVYQKGFDLLIPMFARLVDQHPDWDLWIIGEGEKRQELEALVAQNNLQNRVFLPGKKNNPFPTVKAADLFVLSSRFEGLPGVLIAALGCGIPAISFDCPSGPAEIIHDGVDGLLIPAEDTDAFIAAMDKLMRDEPLRKQMGAKAVEARERFGLDRAVQEWEKLFKTLDTK